MPSALEIKEMSASYGEPLPIEQPAIALLRSPGWTRANLYTETLGEPLQ